MSRLHVATAYAARSRNVVLRRRKRRKMRAEYARSELSPLLNLESDSAGACKEAREGDWFFCRRKEGERLRREREAVQKEAVDCPKVLKAGEN